MDKGPAFTGRAFAAKAAALRLAHHRIRPRPLKQNAVVERSPSTLRGVQCLPHFHLGRVADIPGLDHSLQAQTRDCSEHHPNHGN